jgi:hypothetical protein
MSQARIKSSAGEVLFAGVAISRTLFGNLHAGIAHRTPEGVDIIHLAWDCKLENEPATASEAFPLPLFLTPDIDPEDEKVVAGLCRRIFEATVNQSITYCIGTFPYPGCRFENGLFRSSHPLIGLNCSAFVCQVFRDADIPIINIDSWPPRPERDVPAQRWLVSVMEAIYWSCQIEGRETTLTPDKIEFNRSQIGRMPRVAPEETAGACLEPRSNLPATCEICEPKGEWVVALIDKRLELFEAGLPVRHLPVSP